MKSRQRFPLPGFFSFKLSIMAETRKVALTGLVRYRATDKTTGNKVLVELVGGKDAKFKVVGEDRLVPLVNLTDFEEVADLCPDVPRS